ncbi:MAG: hypothetical protein RIS44_373 [Pseudomonadota bacterium]|jgi:hypothetical protein
MVDDFFALPSFKPVDALQQLKRHVRDLRVLTEKGSGFELQGVAVLDLHVQDDAITARIARRRSQRSEWDVQTLKSSADVRKLQDDIKRRLLRWVDED